MKKMNEFSFIEYLKQKISYAKQVQVGIGDDAAVLNLTPGKQLVVSTDAIVEGVDFFLKGPKKGLSLRAKRGNLTDRHAPIGLAMTGGGLSPERIGRKALAINLSDLAAMGAKPIAFVLSIGKPKYISTRWLERFYDGLLKLAKQYKVDCIGGDFSRAKEFSVSVAILGTAKKSVLRSGAKAGDWIGVTGVLGGSLLRHHYDFTPRVQEGFFLSEKFAPTAMIDISDGLCQDLGHILKASGVGAVLELDKIPVSQDANKMAKGKVHAALQRALSDGEDFELLFTVPPRQKGMLEKQWKKHFPKVPLTWIGKIEGKVPKIRWVVNGKTVSAPKLPRKGFSHF